ncbi:gas vesicle protein GvpJ [Streptomyces roseicoloratus]|uniref:Gas vesicle protein GvpJ n=1 Tax=Streptomyces roseicoloratus TaxID=2508722 RepID=A0ABY9S2P8_9ACTN|nr:gas vesicle protein GvpJ [Streptomyces roseicoloratus]WMX48702.1 gas vesicle protein GvpJ [Streptomyces roseicoloratus]
MGPHRPLGRPPLSPYGQTQGANLADILERVLDKGIVIVGDIRINLLDIELLTIRLRLLVASVDKAREIGIDWWEHDPALSSRAEPRQELEEENARLRAELESLRARPVARSGSRSELSEGSTNRRRRTTAPDDGRRAAAPERKAGRRAASEGKKSRSRVNADREVEDDDRDTD